MIYYDIEIVNDNYPEDRKTVETYLTKAQADDMVDNGAIGYNPEFSHLEIVKHKDSKVLSTRRIYKIRPILASDRMYSDTEKSIADLIAQNDADELTAIANYENLIARLEQVNADPEDIEHIQHIIAEEKEHNLILNKLLRKYDEVDPAID